MPAPIALFVYCRPSHTRQTVEALSANLLASESDLFVFCDAAKNTTIASAVQEVRDYVRSLAGFKSITIVEREHNFGLANSIIDGTTQLCGQFGRVIVLEDDLVTSPHFLSYMNDALDKYADQPDVYSISGYSFTHHGLTADPSYFLRITSSWGWATWARKWKVFRRDQKALGECLKQSTFRERFNFADSYDYSVLAQKQLSGVTDSWAIYWYFCVFQRNGLTLFPAESLVKNCGLDGSGTHQDESAHQDSLSLCNPALTTEILEKEENRKIVQAILRKRYRTQSLLNQFRSVCSRLLHG